MWRALGLVIVFGLVVVNCQARVLWEDQDGFMLESANWIDVDGVPDWTGVLCGLTIPDGGWFAIKDVGALEIWIPSKGWVLDKGIIVTRNCVPYAETNKRVCNLIPEYGCKSAGGRVTMTVKIPKMNTFKDDHPTVARWVQRKVMYDVAED